MRSIFGHLAFAFVIGLSGAFPARAAEPRVGAPAPAITVRTLGGQEIDLTHLAGKVVVVNIWATWCAPCRAEMPMLNAFYVKHESQVLLLFGLSADRSRDKSEVSKESNERIYLSRRAAVRGEGRQAGRTPSAADDLHHRQDRRRAGDLWWSWQAPDGPVAGRCRQAAPLGWPRKSASSMPRSDQGILGLLGECLLWVQAV